MADDSAASGGLLVILGILFALGIGFLAFKQGIFGGTSAPSIKIELPKAD